MKFLGVNGRFSLFFLFLELDEKNRIFAQNIRFMNPQILLDLIQTPMPFGKYKGTKIYRLPEAYLVWFSQKGFPEGKIGELLQNMLVIKENGLEYLLREIERKGLV